jgi:hypothetical protein
MGIGLRINLVRSVSPSFPRAPASRRRPRPIQAHMMPLFTDF